MEGKAIPRLGGERNILRLTDGSDEYAGNHEQQRDRAVNTDGVARGINEPEPLMKEGSYKMNQQICETKGVAPDHPIPVADDPLPSDLDESGNCNNQPYDIQSIEAHTAYFSAGGVGRHVTGGQHDHKHGYDVNITVNAMESALFLEYPF